MKGQQPPLTVLLLGQPGCGWPPGPVTPVPQSSRACTSQAPSPLREPEWAATCSEGHSSISQGRLQQLQDTSGNQERIKGILTQHSRRGPIKGPFPPCSHLSWRASGAEAPARNPAEVSRGSWHTNKARGVSLQYKFVFIEAAVT